FQSTQDLVWDAAGNTAVLMEEAHKARHHSARGCASEEGGPLYERGVGATPRGGDGCADTSGTAADHDDVVVALDCEPARRFDHFVLRRDHDENNSESVRATA